VTERFFIFVKLAIQRKAMKNMSNRNPEKKPDFLIIIVLLKVGMKVAKIIWRLVLFIYKVKQCGGKF